MIERNPYTGNAPAIFVAVHTQNERGGWIHPQLYDFAWRAKDDAIAAGTELRFASIDYHPSRTNELKPQSVARQRTVVEFLKTDCTHLLMIDNDNPPSTVGENTNPFRMLRFMHCNPDFERPVEIVAAAVMTYKRGDTPFTLYKRHPSAGPHHLRTLAGEEIAALEDTDGFVELDAAGTGMMMIDRCVIEQLYPHCFAADIDDPWDRKFFDHYNSTGFPEDIFFTRKAKELHGFGIAGDFRTICSHFHTVDILEFAIDRPERRKKTTPTSSVPRS
jgi:hypothetical protein